MVKRKEDLVEILKRLGKEDSIKFIKKTYSEENHKIPDYYECSICMDVMVDPVVTSSGNSYEKEALKEYLLKGDKFKDPLSGVELSKV